MALRIRQHDRIPTYGGYPAPRTTSPISHARETIIEPGRLTGGSQGTPTLSAFHLKPSRKLSRPWPKKPLRKSIQNPRLLDHAREVRDRLFVDGRRLELGAAAGSPSGNNHMGARAERAAAGIVTKQKTAPLPAPFLVHLRVESAHFDWRWRPRPALALLGWGTLALVPFVTIRRIQVTVTCTTINFGHMLFSN